MTAGAPAYRALLEPLDLPAAAVPALAAYLDLLDAWSARVNLTGARTPAERVALLVRAVAPLGSRLRAGSVLDVGSGNGSPGLVLAALRPELPMTLLEPRQRRWAFLREAARTMGRPDVAIRKERHDQYTGPPAANVVVRALALPLPELAPLVAPGGQLIVLGRPPAGDHADLAAAESWSPGVWSYSRT